MSLRSSRFRTVFTVALRSATRVNGRDVLLGDVIIDLAGPCKPKTILILSLYLSLDKADNAQTGQASGNPIRMVAF
jgi:hypothetical protein